MNGTTQHYRGAGKLLLTGEYFVLDGAEALAVPTRAGQSLSVTPGAAVADGDLSWTSLDQHGRPWLREALRREDWLGYAPEARPQSPRARLLQLFAAAERLRPGSTAGAGRGEFVTRLEFDRRWGLGSSSTLVYCLARHLGVDAYALLADTFGGSGYDLACAGARGPLLYRNRRPRPAATPLAWRPPWVEQTVFVYRNRKQDSRAGIATYRAAGVDPALVRDVTALTAALTQPTLLPRAAARILSEHERLVGRATGQTPIQEALFADFPGVVKSLGAWGGDFVWAVSDWPAEKAAAYFNARGFGTVIPYDAMILPSAE